MYSIDREKDRCLEERRAPMKIKKKVTLTEEQILSRFDCFVKKTMKNIIDDVLRSYVKHRSRSREVSIDDLGDLAAPEKTPEIEKIEVVLGSSSVLFENEQLAAGLKRLTEKQRKILECAFILDMPNKAIAELLELEAETIRNYKSDAYGILRRYMGDRCNA